MQWEILQTWWLLQAEVGIIIGVRLNGHREEAFFPSLHLAWEQFIVPIKIIALGDFADLSAFIKTRLRWYMSLSSKLFYDKKVLIQIPFAFCSWDQLIFPTFLSFFTRVSSKVCFINIDILEKISTVMKYSMNSKRNFFLK